MDLTIFMGMTVFMDMTKQVEPWRINKYVTILDYSESTFVFTNKECFMIVSLKKSLRNFHTLIIQNYHQNQLFCVF